MHFGPPSAMPKTSGNVLTLLLTGPPSSLSKTNSTSSSCLPKRVLFQLCIFSFRQPQTSLANSQQTHTLQILVTATHHVVFVGALKSVTSKLQRVLNVAASVVCGTRKFDCGLIQLLQADLQWLDMPECAHTHTHTHTHTQPFNSPWSGTTRVGRYQKKHSPIHTHPGYQNPLSTFIYYDL